MAPLRAGRRLGTHASACGRCQSGRPPGPRKPALARPPASTAPPPPPPQFGPGAMQQHGFARNVDWAIASTSADPQPDDQDPEVTLVLTDSDYTRAMWWVGWGCMEGGRGPFGGGASLFGAQGWFIGGQREGACDGRGWLWRWQAGREDPCVGRAALCPSPSAASPATLCRPRLRRMCRPHSFQVAYSVALHGAHACVACSAPSALPGLPVSRSMAFVMHCYQVPPAMSAAASLGLHTPL